MRIKGLWIYLICLLLAFVAFANDDWAAIKAAMGRAHETHTKAIVSTHNDTIAVQLDDTDGQFNIGKTIGSVTLLYNYPSSPWSSWSCFYIDGTHYTNDFGGFGDPTGSVDVGGGTVTYPFTLVPHSGDSSFIRGGWRQSNMDIYQILQPVYVEHDAFIDAFIFIKYVIVNTDTVSHRVGIILQMDTMVDANDAAELGTIWGYSGIEEDWTYDSMPPWWFAYEAGPPPPAGAITAMGILDGFDAVRPDRFAVGGWGSFNSLGTWTYSTTGAPYSDSAVLYWWGVDTIAPGDSLIGATYYGIGHPYNFGSFTFLVDDVDVENCVYSPNPFSFFVMFTNESAMSLDSVTIHLLLPPGLSSASGSVDTLMNGGAHLGTGGSGVMSWDIAITSPPAWDSITVFVTSPSTSDTFWPDEPYRMTLPFVGAPPQGSLIDPSDSAWTTCSDQGIMLNFASENGLDLPSDMTFVVSGSVLDLTSPLLSWEDDTLTYSPTSNWTDGATVDWALVEATDAMGCSLETPVLGSFSVDLSAPIAENEWPEDGSILGSPDIEETWIELYDVIRAVDPSSIVFTCNSVAYSVSDPALFYSNDTLRFNIEDAGIVLADGDTVCFEITSAADLEPDYCEANEMAPYSWCFSINIIDLALPDTHLCPPGDTFDIPIFCEDLAGLGITELDITVEFIDDVLQPLGVELSGSVASGWPLSVTTTPNRMHITGSGAELGSGDVLFYIKFFVPSGHAEGSYSPLNFIDATFNAGELASKPVDGFATVCFDTHMWSNDLTFSISDQNRRILTLGVTGSATDGYNPGLDIQSLPVPSTHVDGYFDISDPSFPLITRLERDMRGPAPLPIVWTGYAGSPIFGAVTCRWNPSHFPPGMVYMIYTDGGITRTINMKRIDNITFSDETEFTVIYDQPEIGRAEFTTCPGWNLLSFPFVPNEAISFREMVPHSITNGYWYNPDTYSYISSLYPEPGKGYWVFCTDSDTFFVGGMLVSEAHLDIRTGWNLVGIPWEDTGILPFGALTSEPDVILPTNVYGYDACGTATYFTPTDLEVGSGYWVLSTADAFMTIIGDSTVSKALPVYEPAWQLPMMIGNMPYIIGIDSRANEKIDAFDRAIPPYNPDGGLFFGGTCEGFYLARDIKPSTDSEFVISAGAKILSWDPSAISPEFELILYNGKSVLDMRSFDSVLLEESAKIKVNRVLPEVPTLYSAVPNPFNPVTEIKFALPEESKIELGVYDLLGKRVAILIDDNASAGVHTTVWRGTSDDGKEMPSGIYFYRLLVVESGKAITKSMILLR
ncbi:hypothetical protein KAH81_02965 [bacterium]|nr:hypothetical protein [bacterium]